MNGRNRECIEREQPRIIQQLNDLTTNPPEGVVVPLDVITAVAFYETHLGCDANEGGNWGAPISAARRHTAGTHRHAARILVRGFQVCGTWERAVFRFRTGMCSVRGLRPDIARIGTRYTLKVNTLRARLRAST